MDEQFDLVNLTNKLNSEAIDNRLIGKTHLLKLNVIATHLNVPFYIIRCKTCRCINYSHLLHVVAPLER